MSTQFTHWLRLVAITNRHRVANLNEAVATLLLGGVTAIMIREKDLNPAELLELAKPIKALCQQHGAALIINGCVETVLALGADALHLGFGGPALAQARAQVGDTIIIGVSAHEADDLNQLQSEGADYACFSPVFVPNSKVTSAKPVGISGLQLAVSKTHLPLVALGGINPDRAAACFRAGAVGVAGIGSFFCRDIMRNLQNFKAFLG